MMQLVTKFSYRMGLIILLLIALAMVACTGSEEGEIKVLRWGLIPADDAAEMLRQYQPVVDYLEGELGIEIEIEVTVDYTAAIEAMRYKHIDMAWFGPFSYIIAAEEAGAEAIVNGVRQDTGKSTYKTIFVTRADSGIETLDDLVGRSFAFVDPASTSGNLIPRKVLLENGIDPDNDFSIMYYAGTHNGVELAVKNGTVDAGADSDTSYYRMINEGQIDPEVNVIIFESEPIPGSPIAVRGDLPQELKDSIQQALIEMDEQTLFQVQGWGDIEKYVEVTDSDYDIIRETRDLLDL
ncbi:MAG: phosphonate ABC transporter substrate-binding protein [Dehalococcoidia bacterium]|nr:phosphonate ABC transporter substrate-binding protein [Dehalococcoidia bacterium]